MGDTRRRRPNRADLFDLASEQHGYFTTAQAARCGYAPDMLTYHVKQGTFARVHRGVYRFRDFPFRRPLSYSEQNRGACSWCVPVEPEREPEYWASHRRQFTERR